MNVEVAKPVSVASGEPMLARPATQEVEQAQRAAQAAALREQQSAPEPNAVRAAAHQIDSYLKSVGRNLDFRVDEDTGRTVVTVRDATTGDVIRQIPSEEALALARSLGASSAALLDVNV